MQPLGVYLLVLSLAPSAISELELAHPLGYAARSDKSAVWVDCRLVNTLLPAAVRLLEAYYFRLRQRGAQLVLCRVLATLAQVLSLLCIGLSLICIW